MVLLPQAVSLILCERASAHVVPETWSLLGIFHRRRYPAYPAPAEPLSAYSLLYDGWGEGTMELQVVRLQGGQSVYRQRRWWVLRQRFQWRHFEMKLRRCVFPERGEYLCSLCFDGRSVAERRFELF